MSVKSLKTGTRSVSLLAGNVPEHHVLIAESTVGAGGAASVTFSNIPADYQHLQIRGISAGDTGYIRFNSDSGSNYARHFLMGDGTSATSGNSTSQTSMAIWPGGTTSPIFSAAILDVLDYASTAKNKTVRILRGTDANGSGSVLLMSGLWMNNTTAVSSIVISATTTTFSQNSTFQLYGVK